MRVFIAIPLPLHLKARLGTLQEDFRRLALEAAWARDAGFHITLKFLGEVDTSQIAPITSSMLVIGQQYASFSLTLAGVGVFPHAANPRVLWVGVEDETGRLRQLQHTLEAELAQIGYAPESRPFAPHLTLARLKRISRRGEFLATLKTHRQAVLGQLEVDHFALIESRLHPSGASYSTVSTVYLPRATESSSVDR